jgi:hypothetical protein
MNTLTDKESKVYEALKANAETANSVYLDNARQICGMEKKEFNGVLSALEKKNLYVPYYDEYKGIYGIVK